MKSWFRFLRKDRRKDTSLVSASAMPEGHAFGVRKVRGDVASDALIRFRDEPGVVPVMFGNSEEYEQVCEFASLNDIEFDECVKRGESIDVAEWFVQRVAADPEYYASEASDDDEGELSTPGGTLQVPTFSTAFDMLTRQPKPEVLIGLLPLEKPWHVPALLRMGNWNECPAPEEHVALFRYWYERYGAVVACVTNDVVEFTVARPPSTIEQARVLAREHYIYCADIVQQGAGSEEALARTLLDGRQWYFWWD